MIVGYSNGGGMGVFANIVYGGWVTKAVAIDYGAHYDIAVWLPAWVSANSMMAVKMYYSCHSEFYSTDGVIPSNDASSFQTLVGALTTPLTLDAAYSTETYGPIPHFTYSDGTTYPGLPYKVWKFSNADGRYLHFAVHGLDDPADGTDTTDPSIFGSGACNMHPSGEHRMCTEDWGASYCTPGILHTYVPWYVDYVGDILDWTTQHAMSAGTCSARRLEKGRTKGGDGATCQIRLPENFSDGKVTGEGEEKSSQKLCGSPDCDQDEVLGQTSCPGYKKHGTCRNFASSPNVKQFK
jgi:hypothetical protein